MMTICTWKNLILWITNKLIETPNERIGANEWTKKLGQMVENMLTWYLKINMGKVTNPITL